VGIFSRGGGAAVVVSPAVVGLRQTVEATVTTDKPIDKVASARLDWGYTNFFNYHWAGRVDSAAAAGNDTIWTMDQVGTSYGGDRDTDEWVSVVVEDIPAPHRRSASRPGRLLPRRRSRAGNAD
jgi:hypothetical protein